MTGGSSRSLVVKDVDQKSRKATVSKAVSVKKSTVKKSLKKSPPKKISKPVTVAKAKTKKRVAKKAAVKKTTAKPTPKQKPSTKPAIKKPSTKTAHLANAKPISQTEISTLKREPLGHLLVEQKLQEAGFRGTLSTDKDLLATYSTDESIFSVRPQVVLQPRHQRDVETAVKVIADQTKKFPSLSLTPRAAGTGLSGGSLTDSLVVDVCQHMNHISEVVETKGQITISCEPGAMWRDVEKKLKIHGAYIPSFPASKDICTIGGAVANNSAGPDSLRFGHTARWVAALDVTLFDGQTYTLKPLTYKEFKAVVKKSDAYGTLAKSVFDLIQKNETEINKARPKTTKNSAGYALWDILDVSVTDFKKNKGHFDLTQLMAGSQGTIGIITSITMKAEPIKTDTHLIAVPIFNLADAGKVVIESLKYDPINVEVFDGLSFDLALKNPNFFKDRIKGSDYYRVMLSMYTTYHIRFRRKIPEFTLLITIDHASLDTSLEEVVTNIRAAGGSKARLIKNPIEREMCWQIRRASYSLSKLEDPNKRPAAFLEDMTVPPENLAKFFLEIKKLLKKYRVTAAVHGHGGNGHFHFYPLLDFTKPGTADIVMKMSEEFFATAIKYGGNICGEHNDGIIRTPHLSKIFSKKTLDLFKAVENLFDPDDIFNPGKKVNPRFDIKDTLRHSN